MSSPKVESRPKAWDSLKITILWSVNKPSVSLDECELIKPIAMQFALRSKSQRATFLQKLSNHRIELSETERKSLDGHLELTVTTQLKEEDEVKNHVVDALIESLKDIEWFEIDKETYDYHPVRSEISKVSRSADFDRLILFDGEDAMYVVGESTDIKRCKEQMKVEQSLLTKYKWANLKKLKIEEYFKSKNIKVKVFETGNAVKVRGSFCEAEKASKEINLFCDKICKMPVNFDRMDLDLLFLENGDLNFAVLDLFRKSLEEKHVKSFIEIDEADHLLYICSLDEKELRRSKEVINGCINTHTVAIPMYNAIKPLLEEYKNKMKVFIGDKSVKLVCTNDVPFTELIDPEDIPLPQIVIEFLAGYGRENLNMIENTNGVIVTIDEENSVFRINGKNENRKKFKKHLKKSNCIDTFPLEVCSSLVKKHEDELQKIANSRQCCLQARYLNDSAFLSKDCKKVVNWKYLRRCPNVSLIVGQIKELKTDYKVLFVTDKLCPLHKCDLSSDEYENNIEQLDKMEIGTINLGEVIDYGQKEEGCQTKAIVIAKANGEDAFQCKKLKQPIQEIFTEVTDKKAKSIAIQITLFYENLSMKELVALCLSEILSHHVELEVYLVCHPSEDVNEVAQTIDSIYQKKGPGYYRENHTQDISLKNSFRSIKTEVKIESLVDMKVDVIVNTIGITLDFDGGQLSKIISRKAGRSIVEECRINYPKGIESGSLAITRPGFLKKNVKHIFHCALPIFKKSTFVKDVKEMVKRCLLEMEMMKLKTVAIPAFGTGNLGYPKRETAKAMFDAVEEYQFSCIKSSVESVVFALYVGDIDTSEIFSAEEKRRKQKKQKKKCVADEKKDFPELHTTIGQNEWQVRLTIASEEDLKQLTSNVVLTELKYVKEGGDCELKYSSKSPETKNDILKVFVANNVDAKDTELSDAIGKLMKYCQGNKIAEVVIPTNNGMMIPAEKQIDIIVKKVEEHAKSKGTEHLCKVYVSLPSSDSLDDVERHLKSSLTQSFLSTVKEWVPSLFSTLAWSRSEQAPVEIKIIGCSKELIEQAKDELKEYAYKLHDQNKQDEDGGKTKKTMIQSGKNGDECIISGDECKTNEDECIINQDDSVTAELNPGIVSCLKGQQTFDTWRKKIMDLYKVSCRKRAGGIEVCGSFISILSLETYLDDYFSQDEGQYERKDGLQEKDEDSTLQNDEEKKNQDKWQDEDKDIWQGKEQVKLQEPTYTIAGMDIILTEIKLTDLEVDCIVVPLNERLETVGLDDVKQLAGNKYEEACEKNLSAYGEVILSECRMTDSGKLLCSKVLHFMEPSWHKDTWSQSLKVLQDSIVKCLETADKSLFSTIAIPVIYSGKKMFSKNEGQAYVGALRAFSKYNKHISKVFISVQDKSKQEMLMKALIDDVGRENEAEGLATRPVETSFSIDYRGKNGLVRICSKIGEVHADNVCAVVSEAVDRPSTGESNIGNKNNRKSASLRSKNSSVGSVIERKVEGVNLNCRYVLQTVIPRRNKKYTQSTGKFEDDIKQTVVNVLNTATNLECQSVALPLMGMSEDPSIPTPFETCCTAMLKGITTFLSNSKSHLVQIDIVDTSTDVARKLRNELQKIKPKEGIV